METSFGAARGIILLVDQNAMETPRLLRQVASFCFVFACVYPETIKELFATLVLYDVVLV